jgi:hypothetical protein
MSEFITNDVVRVGKGKVEYTVVEDSNADVTRVQSLNTGKVSEVETSRLVFVRGGARGPHAPAEALDLAVGVETPEIKDIPTVVILAQDIAVSSTKDALTLIVDGHAVRAKGSFETLAFELSRLKGTYSVASIARNGKALVTRYAA